MISSFDIFLILATKKLHPLSRRAVIRHLSAGFLAPGTLSSAFPAIPASGSC